jgi:hypothetical protein
MLVALKDKQNIFVWKGLFVILSVWKLFCLKLRPQRLVGTNPGLPDLTWYNIPNWEKYTKLPQNIPNDYKMNQMAAICTKYTDIFHCKSLQNLPKLGFLVWKYAIWQAGTNRRRNKEFAELEKLKEGEIIFHFSTVGQMKQFRLQWPRW